MMTSAGGLSRRRNNNAQGSMSGLEGYSNYPGLDGTSPQGSSSVKETSGDDDIKEKQLTLMEELLLLGLKDSQGTLSFWNDNISYVLRGCILMELSFRSRIQVKKGDSRRRSFQDRVVEVIDNSNTGEVLLDEALRYMKGDEDTVANWIDFLSGETWNLLKIGYQLKQVRERIAKGLVDKGVLRTEKKSFVIFDMATHPVADTSVKRKLVRKLSDALLSRSARPDKRTIALICAAYAANLLDNVLVHMNGEQKESAYLKADEILKEGANLTDQAKNEGFTEVVAGVLTVYAKMDSIL